MLGNLKGTGMMFGTESLTFFCPCPVLIRETTFFANVVSSIVSYNFFYHTSKGNQQSQKSFRFYNFKTSRMCAQPKPIFHDFT